MWPLRVTWMTGDKPRATVRRVWLLVCAAMVLTASAGGQTTPPHPAPDFPDLVQDPAVSKTPIRRDASEPGSALDHSRGSSVWVTWGALAALGLASVYLSRRWRNSSEAGPTTNSFVVCGSRRLDGHTTAHLVRVGQRVLLVASTAAGARTLGEFDAGDLPDIMGRSSTDAVFPGRKPIRTSGIDAASARANAPAPTPEGDRERGGWHA